MPSSSDEDDDEPAQPTVTWHVPTLQTLARRRLLDFMSDQIDDAMRIREAVGRYIRVAYPTGLHTDEAIDRVIQACDDLYEELREQSYILHDFLRPFRQS